MPRKTTRSSTKATPATAPARKIGPHGRHSDSAEAVEEAVATGTLERRALRLHEAAATLGISRWHLDKLINEGVIGTVQLGSLRLVPTGELDRVLETRLSREARQT